MLRKREEGEGSKEERTACDAGDSSLGPPGGASRSCRFAESTERFSLSCEVGVERKILLSHGILSKMGDGIKFFSVKPIRSGEQIQEAVLPMVAEDDP